MPRQTPTHPNSAHLAKQLAQVALGDRAAFKQVYEMTSAHLFGIALRILRNREIAEEIMQECFVNVWHHAGSYQAQTSQPMTWLISIVRNKAFDYLGSAAHRHEQTGETAEWTMALTTEPTADVSNPNTAEAAHNPLHLLSDAADALHIQQCLEKLEAGARQSIALAFYQGLSHGEVAAHIQTPLGTVKAWIRRGLQRMKDCLERAQS